MRMKTLYLVKVREFGLLLKEGDRTDIDCHSISGKAFDWLLANGQSFNDKSVDLVRVKKYGKGIALQVVNYVGVLETPCGTRIEILPKIEDGLNPEQSKAILLKMLSIVNDLPLKQFESSSLKTLKQPLFEILISRFLKEVSDLIKRGVRNEYKRVDERKRYLKGQLKIAKQITQRPGFQNSFHVSYDYLSSDRAENRLIQSSLSKVMKWTKSNENIKLGKELQFALDGIPSSINYVADFRKWSTDRTLVHYRSAKSWCELILSYQSPISFSGHHQSISFLFPMEILFERYVAIKLRHSLPPNLMLKTQSSSQTLVYHCSPKSERVEGWFRLKPDIVISNKCTKEHICVADTKWKRINENHRSAKWKYGISQSDMYQLFAYGEKYLRGKGDLFLIYPKYENFTERLAPFLYNDGLKLHVVPYDLELDECEIKSYITS